MPYNPDCIITAPSAGFSTKKEPKSHGTIDFPALWKLDYFFSFRFSHIAQSVPATQMEE